MIVKNYVTANPQMPYDTLRVLDEKGEWLQRLERNCILGLGHIISQTSYYTQRGLPLSYIDLESSAEFVIHGNGITIKAANTSDLEECVETLQEIFKQRLVESPLPRRVA